MQSKGPEKRQMLEARDLERPLGGGLAPIEAVIEVVKSDCPDEWARYCDLAHRLVQREQPTEISREVAGRQLLIADGKHTVQISASLDSMISGYQQLAGGGRRPKTQLEKTVAETQKLEDLFRNRLVLALQSGRYFLNAFDRLEPHIVPPGLIKPEHFRFGSDEMELNGIKLTGLHFVRSQAVFAPQNDASGRKPGLSSPKDLACEIVLSILNDQAQRPPKSHGRVAALARMVWAVLKKDGKTYELNSIEKFIRGTVREWEKKNPGK
jgi:hypothetical protein